MKRSLWFVSGVAAGAGGMVYVRRKVIVIVESVRPANVAGSVSHAARRAGQRVTGAVREGVSAGRRRERELRAERDGRLVRLSDYLGDGDELVIDGEQVDSARVIVLRDHERDRDRGR
jgi:hypothetical protein